MKNIKLICAQLSGTSEPRLYFLKAIHRHDTATQDMFAPQSNLFHAPTMVQAHTDKNGRTVAAHTANHVHKLEIKTLNANIKAPSQAEKNELHKLRSSMVKNKKVIDQYRKDSKALDFSKIQREIMNGNADYLLNLHNETQESSNIEKNKEYKSRHGYGIEKQVLGKKEKVEAVVSGAGFPKLSSMYDFFTAGDQYVSAANKVIDRMKADESASKARGRIIEASVFSGNHNDLVKIEYNNLIRLRSEQIEKPKTSSDKKISPYPKTGIIDESAPSIYGRELLGWEGTKWSDFNSNFFALKNNIN